MSGRDRFFELPVTQDQIIGLLRGQWENNQIPIGLFGEALLNNEAVVSLRCGDSRDWVEHVGSAVENYDVPWVIPVKGIAGYPRLSADKLVKVTRGAGILEVPTHHDPQGLVVGNPEMPSICGGKDAMFAFYGSDEYQWLLKQHDGGLLADVDFDRGMREFVHQYTNKLGYHGIPLPTADAVVSDLFWHRSPSIAYRSWNQYLLMTPGGDPWKMDLLSAVQRNVSAFRESGNVGLDAFVRAWAYANLLADRGVEGKWVTVGLSNHRVQATVPLAIIRTFDRMAWAKFPGGVDFQLSVGSRGHHSLHSVIQAWQELVFDRGALNSFAQNELLRYGTLLARYYKYASKPTLDNHLVETTKSQGDFMLSISAVDGLNPIVFAGGMLKHKGSFGVTVLGDTDQGLSYRDQKVLDHLGYAQHLGSKGLVLFADSEQKAKDILKYVFLGGWGKDYDAKGNVVVMVVERRGDRWQARYYGTKITDDMVELIEK